MQIEAVRRSRGGVVAAGAVAVGVLVVATVPAGADRTTEAWTDPGGATVHVVESSVVAAGRPLRDQGCARRFVPAEPPGIPVFLPGAAVGLAPLPPSPSSEHRPFHVFCDGLYVGTVWAIPAGDPAPAQVARELLAQLPFPPVEIGASPALGLTGLESWFWVDGAARAPRSLTRSGEGITIDLEVALARVVWDFGDGTSLAAGLGEPPPERSNVAHTYETKGRYAVGVRFEHTARYRVDGGAWITLDAVAATASRTYDVIEIRALLSAS